MSKMEMRVGFTGADKAMLASNADWGKTIAPEMADHFYSYLNRDAEMSQILNEKEGRMHRLRETFTEGLFKRLITSGVIAMQFLKRTGFSHVSSDIVPRRSHWYRAFPWRDRKFTPKDLPEKMDNLMFAIPLFR